MTTIHKIEAGPIEDRYARGWHCLGLAEDYKDGKPRVLDVFGTRLVAYQEESGKINIVDGTRLCSNDLLKQEAIETGLLIRLTNQLHWNTEAKWNDVPSIENGGSQWKNGSRITCEENGLLFVWNDPEGNPPPSEVTIPRFDTASNGTWSDWQIVNWIVNTNCRELVDTLVDIAHFSPVHGAPVKYFANIFEGHIGTQIMVGGSQRLAANNTLTAHSSYFGPATHFTYMTGEAQGMAIESILLNAHVPIDLNSFELRFGVIVKKIASLSEEENKQIANAYVKASQEAFQEDVDIWEAKTRVDNPILCIQDGPLYQLREWYQQFYTDVAGVPKRLSMRQVFEIGHVSNPPRLCHVFQ